MPRVAKMRNLNERIGARAQLHALDPSEAREYVESRLHSKGGNAAKIFAPAALKYLLAKSRGIPRRINVLCHNAMLLAYGAGQKRVELEMAKAAVAEYDGTVTPARSSIREMLPFASPMSRMAIGGTALAALVGIFAIGAIHFVSPVSTTSTALSDTRNDSSFAVNRAPYDQARMNQAMQRQAKGVTANDEGGTASEMSQSQGELAPDQHGRRAVRVQPGDTIAVIAGRYFGGNVDDSVIQKMVEANPQLGDVNRIYPGQVVYLPSPTELSRKDQ
jgi:nucleoid-associated protein YgaU